MQDFSPYHPPIAIEFLGLSRLGITSTVLMLFLSAFLTWWLLFYLSRHSTPYPQGFLANLIDTLVGFVRETIVLGFGGKEMLPWTGFATTLFFFVLLTNLLGLIPFPPFVSTATALPAVVIGLAAVIFSLMIGLNIKHHGVAGFLHKFVPPGVPTFLVPLMFVIELVGFLARPASLAIRLCANMNAGHMVLGVFVAMTKDLWAVPLLLKVGAVLPIAAAAAMTGFEVFVGFIQAMVFTVLSVIYLSDAAAHHHE